MRPGCLIPSNCIVCNKSIHKARSLCDYCEKQLPWLGQTCHGCGMEFENLTLQNHRCGQCLIQSNAIDACHGLFHYSSPIDRLIPAFKFQSRLDVGSCLAELLALAMKSHYQSSTWPDLILPVPIHRHRYLQRGFNQSWELCKSVSSSINIESSDKLVRKRRHTRPQAELVSAKERAGNLRGAFVRTPVAIEKNVKTVTIIDDVITTMSTVSTLASLLKDHGIQRVEAWCVARAGIR